MLAYGNRSRNGGTSRRYTFADALQGAHLGVVLHGVQGEVDLGQRLLLAHGTHCIVDVLRLSDILLSGVHAGREAGGLQRVGSCMRGAGVEVKATSGRR